MLVLSFLQVFFSPAFKRFRMIQFGSKWFVLANVSVGKVWDGNQKEKDKESTVPLGVFTHQRTESRNPNRHLHSQVHSNIVHNGPKMETTRVSINRRMGMSTVKCYIVIYSMEYYCHKEERNSDTYHNMDDSKDSTLSQTLKDKY